MTTTDERLRRIEDRLEIADLRARYCHLLDDRRWPEFVDLFTEDGVFSGLESVRGREEIRAFFTERVPKLAEAFWHFCTDGTIELDGDEARGRISLQYLSIKGGVSYVSAGHYDDTFRRVDGRLRGAGTAGRGQEPLSGQGRAESRSKRAEAARAKTDGNGRNGPARDRPSDDCGGRNGG